MPTIRTFIAITLPPEVREALGRYQRMLGAPQASYVKWVRPEGVHLTLKFLGNVDEARLPALAEALTNSVAGLRSFVLQTGGLGAFPSPRNPRVLWIAVEGELEPLQALYRAVEHATARLGFPREVRPFAAHLTLGRVRESATFGEKQQLGRALAEAQVNGPLSIPVQELHVMKSELSRTGATYTSLYGVPLGPEA